MSELDPKGNKKRRLCKHSQKKSIAHIKVGDFQSSGSISVINDRDTHAWIAKH